MYFDENIHSKIVRRLDKLPSLPVSDTCHNYENAVCTPCPGLVHLIGLEQKSLSAKQEDPMPGAHD
jgi:hypothetical protein